MERRNWIGGTHNATTNICDWPAEITLERLFLLQLLALSIYKFIEWLSILISGLSFAGRGEPPVGVGDPCAGCNKPILDKFLLNVLERGWHASCVRCCECLQPLTDKCFSRESKLYCRNDFYRWVHESQPGAAPAQTNRYFSLSPQEIRNKVRWLWTGTGAIGPCAKSPGQGVPPELLYVLHL